MFQQHESVSVRDNFRRRSGYKGAKLRLNRWPSSDKMFLKLKRNMNDWLVISLLLSIFGFLKELRPSEPFIYEFLIGEWKNLTADQVNQQVYPVGTYSYLAQLIIVFLITDLCRYKPLIVLLGIIGIVVWAMLLWTKSLLETQILEVSFLFFLNLC